MPAPRRYGALVFVVSLGTHLVLGWTTDLVTLDRWGVVRSVVLALVMAGTIVVVRSDR